MNSRVGFFATLLAVACAITLLPGCGSSGDSERQAEDGTGSLVAEDLPVVEVPTRWAAANAVDMRTLVASTGTVFVGEVTGLSGQRSQAAGTRGASIPISVFEVTVVRSLAGGLSAGQTAALEQPGGVITRTDGSRARVMLEGDDPLQVGTRYLFFATLRADGMLASSPFGRFTVGENGSVAPLGAWTDLPVARQLAGRNVDDAEREVGNAR